MMGDGSFKKALHADDVGTRLEHMMDLQDMWGTAYEVLTRPSMYHTEYEVERARVLRDALDLLQHHMEAGYNETQYAKAVNDSAPPPMTIRPKENRNEKHDPPDGFTTHRDTV